MENATEGTIKETTYWWPRPGSDKPLEKTTFTRRPAIRFAQSATTRNNSPGTDVRLWHLTDLDADVQHVRFQG